MPITLAFALAPWWLAGAIFARRLLRRAEGSAPPRFERVLVGVAVAAFALLLLQGGRFPIYRGDEVNNFARYGEPISFRCCFVGRFAS